MRKTNEYHREDNKAMSFKLNASLLARMESYLASPVACVRTKTEFFNQAIEEFLDREEPICKELELAREVIQNRRSRTRG